MITEAKNESFEKSGNILHSSRLGAFSASAAEYTSSIDIDPRLLPAVIAINKAHLIMLFEQGIVSRDVARKILSALKSLPDNFPMKAELEDVHMNVEDLVISRAGKASGGMLNLAKSRNDQVATALRMTLREELILLARAMVELEKALVSQSKKHSGTLLPGYTHLQRGQPVTLGHHLLAHFDSLDRNFTRLIDCYLRTNLSPMGAAALGSTGFHIDRERTADLLGFDSLVENTLDAVSSRDFLTEAIYLCAQTMTDLSRLAEEIILWTTREFSFAEISDEFTSTSSMMPQKKNAIVPEIFRAKTSQVVGDLTAGLALLKALPLSYNLDLQELTRNLWSAMDKTIASVSVLSQVIARTSFNKEIMEAATISDEFIFATELVDHLVEKYGLPFREAHGRVGRLVKRLSSTGKEQHAQFSSLSPEALEKILQVKITPREIAAIVDPAKVLEKRKAHGSPNPKLVLQAATKRVDWISKHEDTLHSLELRINEANHELRAAAEAVQNAGKVSRR